MSATPLAIIDASRLRTQGDLVPFDFDDPFSGPQKGFVLRWHDELLAYHNRCPHWQTPLDEHGGDLLDRASGTLICQTHGARFEVHDGQCISGPCTGDRLRPLVTKTRGDTVLVYRSGLELQ